MVRLRSERWYSADGQRRSKMRVASQVSGTRRLISLCFLLAMVVVLMQKAADPRHVRNAFEALGAPLDAEAVSALKGRGEVLAIAPPKSGELSQSPAFPSKWELTKWEITCQDLIPRLLDDASREQIIELARRWFAIAPWALNRDGEEDRNDQSQATLQELKNASRQTLSALFEQTLGSNLSPAEEAQWLSNLHEFQLRWQQLWELQLDIRQGEATKREEDAPAVLIGQQPDDRGLELESALTAYLDHRLLGLLRDAAAWSKSETVPFWRLLQRGQGNGRSGILPSGPLDAVPLVNTLQLESETDIYRGRNVRFRGTVRRVEPIERGNVAMGIEVGYWLLWLRGDDNSVQPVAVYTTDRIAASLAERIDEHSADFPVIEVQGIPAKRLAYASQSGLQIAPTLFATSVVSLATPAPVTAFGESRSIWSRLRIALLAGLLLAGAILIPIVLQRRSRSRHTSRREKSVAEKASSYESKRAAKWGLMWIGAVTIGFSASSLPAQEQPPWARASGKDAFHRLLSENLRESFDQGAPVELRDYLNGDRTSFPDAPLKAIHALSKIGWQRALQLDDSIELDGGLSLRPASLDGWVGLTMAVSLSERQRAWFQADDEQQLFCIEVLPQSDLYANQREGDVTELEEGSEGASQSLVKVFCRELPNAWLTGARLRQPARIRALGLYEEHRPGVPLCLFAERPAWVLPRSVKSEQLEPKLEPHLIELGKLGWDLANCDLVSSRNQRPIASEESEAFYSMLGLAASPTSISRDHPSNVGNPLDLLADAKASVGKPLRWRVRLVSGTVVKVDDERSQRLLGGDEYFQLDGFVDIGNQHIRFQSGGTGEPSEPIDFVGEFPVTIVTRADRNFVPAAVQKAAELSWPIGQYAEVDGIFYRLWSYRSALAKSQDASARQVAPLVVALRLTPSAPPMRVQATAVGWFGYALCGATLALLGTILVMVSKKDRRRRLRR